MNPSPLAIFALRSRTAARTFFFCALVALVLALGACGGGEGVADSARFQEQGNSTSTVQGPALESTLSPAQLQAQSDKGAELSSADLLSAEAEALAADANPGKPLDQLPPGAIATKTDYISGNVARKALAVRIPAYRFYNGSTGAHFYTTSEAERDNVINTLSPPFSYEGSAFSVANRFSPGLSPVHRFFNTRTGVHFYTISEAERAYVVAMLPQFSYEGVAYHASQVSGAGFIPLYRFYVPSKGFHFYTASEEETNSIQTNLTASYSYEGVGYYVLDTGWRAEKLPHTGITVSQCYKAGSDALENCLPGVPVFNPAASLNPQQDGHRFTINRMSYSELPNPAGGNFPRTSCVKDDGTGLVWEGKEAGGLRSGSAYYTNQNNNLASDASGYVTAVNSLSLCGYADWRMPTRNELLTIVDYGKTSGSHLNADWFPNTPSQAYWSADGNSIDNSQAWYASSSSNYYTRDGSFRVRLVQGKPRIGPRYSYSTVAYGSDEAHNAVNDAWTGLQWRRCEEGRVWSGFACSGTQATFTHEQALIHAKAQAGWRLPNVKELGSLTDLSARNGAKINGEAFPGALIHLVWTSSPYVRNAEQAWFVNFGYGGFGGSARDSAYEVRLVRISP